MYIDVHQGLPLFESDDQGISMVESGDQGLMDPIKNVCLPLVDRDWWKVLHVWMPYQRN